MVFVSADLGLAGAISDAAVLETGCKLDPAHNQSYSLWIDGRSTGGWQVDGVILDAVRRSAAAQCEAANHEKSAHLHTRHSPMHFMLHSVPNHFRTPPGLRSSVL